MMNVCAMLLYRPCQSETDDAEFNLIDLADLHVLDFGKACLHFVAIIFLTFVIVSFCYVVWCSWCNISDLC